MNKRTALQTAMFATGERQFVLAKRMGLHASRLSSIVNGHLSATDEDMRKIAKALKCSVEELFPETTTTERRTA